MGKIASKIPRSLIIDEGTEGRSDFLLARVETTQQNSSVTEEGKNLNGGLMPNTIINNQKEYNNKSSQRKPGKRDLKWMMLILIAAIFSCGDQPTTLLTEDENETYSEEIPEGIHWREEIETFVIQEDKAEKWDYTTEGLIVIPKDDINNSVDEEMDFTTLKSGDVIMVEGQYIFFVEEVILSDRGAEISVRPFVLTEAIYGDFNVSLLESPKENGGIGNLEVWDKSHRLEVAPTLFGITPFAKGKLESEGHLNFNFASSEFSGKISQTLSDLRPKVEHIRAHVNLEVDFVTKHTFELSAGIKKVWKKEHDLETLNSSLPGVPLGPIILQPAFYVPASIEIGAQTVGTYGVETKLKGSFPLGFEYSRKGFQGSTSDEHAMFPNNEKKATLTGSADRINKTAKQVFVKAKFGLGLDFRLLPLKAQKGGLRATGYEAKLNSDIAVEPYSAEKCYTSEQYIEVVETHAPKLFIDIWGKKWEWKLTPTSITSRHFKEEISKKVSDDFCYGEPAELTLTWTAGTDLDLFLVTPNGTHINSTLSGNTSADGARLIKDVCIEGSSCVAGEQHVETIVWEQDMPEGDYEAWVVNDGGDAADYDLTITFPDGKTKTQSGALAAEKTKSTRMKFTHRK